MGAVKRDLHKNEQEWLVVNLSHKDSVKGLIKYRSRYDLLMDREYNSYDLESTHVDLNNFEKEVLCLYADLDRCIQKSGLSEKQHHIIKMLMNGYTEEEMGEYYKVSQPAMSKSIDVICQTISETASEEWYLKMYKRRHGAMKVCNCCGQELPKNDRYFAKDSQKKDGLSTICKKCKRLKDRRKASC